MKNGKKSKIGLGIMLTGLLAGVGATAVALIKKKKREEVYHEAELKAMNELDDLMAECESENCEGCSCAETCADEPEEVQASFDDEPEEDDDADETSDEPIEDVAGDETEEKPEA